MTENHSFPITPSSELWGRWYEESRGSISEIATKAAQWGADQELKACCEWVSEYVPYLPESEDKLRAARRPKPPSLKEQAMDILDDAHHGDLSDDEMATIRRALKALPDD